MNWRISQLDLDSTPTPVPDDDDPDVVDSVSIFY